MNDSDAVDGTADRVVHDEANHRYLLMRGDTELGREEYDLDNGVIRFLSTVVPDTGERGLGSKLVEGALADVRARGDRQLIPVCPFVKRYVEKNEQYQDLLAIPLDEL